MPKINNVKSTKLSPISSETDVNAGLTKRRLTELSLNNSTKTCPQNRADDLVYIKNTDIELKLKLLDEKVAKNYITLSLGDNDLILDTELDTLSNNSYLYVDDNGVPKKLLALAVLKREILWEDLAADTKRQIQDAIDNSIDSTKLLAGDHIVINGRTISANIGVETLNGKTGAVNLTAADLNAYTKNEVYDKATACSKIDLSTALDELIVDGGEVK